MDEHGEITPLCACSDTEDQADGDCLVAEVCNTSTEVMSDPLMSYGITHCETIEERQVTNLDWR